jgi:hypothetical protein
MIYQRCLKKNFCPNGIFYLPNGITVLIKIPALLPTMEDSSLVIHISFAFFVNAKMILVKFPKMQAPIK